MIQAMKRIRSKGEQKGEKGTADTFRAERNFNEEGAVHEGAELGAF